MPKLILLLASLLLIPTGFSAAQEMRCKSVFNSELSTVLEKISKRSLNNKVYSIGENEGRLLILNSKEYQKWYKEDRFEPQDILILESIDPKLDLPFVSGIIISKPLPTGKSHLDEMAQKLRIPFLYQSKAYELLSPLYKNSFESSISLAIKENRDFKIKLINKEARAPEPIITSVLPKATAANEAVKLYTYQEALKLPIELVGEKFKWLAAFKQKSRLKDNTPEISSLSSVLYNKLMSIVLENGSTLKDWYLHNLEKAKSPEEFKQLLGIMRNQILYLQKNTPRSLENALETAWLQIQKQYPQYSSKTLFSLRSNSAVEDIIAAGLYNSSKFELGNYQSFKSSIFKIWLSGYNTRAFYTRRYFGLIEANHSMPVLVHPFEGQQVAHAILEMSPSLNGGYKFEINLVRGEKELATNPSHEASTAKQSWHWRQGRFESEKSLENQFSKEEIQLLEKISSELQNTLARLKVLEASLQNQWSFEILFQKSEHGELQYKVLQVKNPVSFDQSIQILKGELPRDSFQKLELNTDRFASLHDYVDHAIEPVQLLSLKNYFKSLKDTNPNLTGVLVDNFRFVLVEIQGEKMIITNRNSNYYMHYTIVSNLQSRIPHFPIKVLYAGDMSVRVIPKIGSLISTSPAKAVPYEFLDGLKHKWLPSIDLKPLIRKSIKQAREED